MPEREPKETECPDCGCMHSPKEQCEGVFPVYQEPAYEKPQVDSPYLRKALALFKKKQKKKKKESIDD